MNFNYSSSASAEKLIEIFENIYLLIKISPPQIKYLILDKEKNLIQQSLFINSATNLKMTEYKLIDKFYYGIFTRSKNSN